MRASGEAYRDIQWGSRGSTIGATEDPRRAPNEDPRRAARLIVTSSLLSSMLSIRSAPDTRLSRVQQRRPALAASVDRVPRPGVDAQDSKGKRRKPCVEGHVSKARRSMLDRRHGGKPTHTFFAFVSTSFDNNTSQSDFREDFKLFCIRQAAFQKSCSHPLFLHFVLGFGEMLACDSALQTGIFSFHQNRHDKMSSMVVVVFLNFISTFHCHLPLPSTTVTPSVMGAGAGAVWQMKSKITGSKSVELG